MSHSLTYSLSDNLKARDASASKNVIVISQPCCILIRLRRFGLKDVFTIVTVMRRLIILLLLRLFSAKADRLLISIRDVIKKKLENRPEDALGLLVETVETVENV